MANGRLEKVVVNDEADLKKRIKREFFLSKKVFNEIVDDVNESEDYTNFSAWVFDACRQKLNKNKSASKEECENG